MPRRDEWDSEDEWVARGFHRHIAAPAPPSFLSPNQFLGASHRRSRSTGARPVPNNVTVINRNDLDHSPPRSRSRRRFADEDLVDAVDDVAREIRRGRSRDPENRWRDPSPYYANMQLELARERERNRMELERERERLEMELDRDRMEARERADTEAQLIRTRAEIRALKLKLKDDELGLEKQRDEDKWKRELELERLKDDTKRRADEQRRREDRDRILAEREREERLDKEKKRLARLEWGRKEEEEEEERKRIVNEFRLKEEKKKREEEEKQKAILAAYEKQQKDEKKKREELYKQMKAEEKEKEEKEKAEKERWRLKLEAEEQARKDKIKKEKEEMDEELRKRLARVGFQNNQVDAILDPKKADKVRSGQLPSNALILSGSQKPTYIRIHRNHIDVETLRYYGLPWDYDHSDTNYIVIMQEIDHHETEILFEHTRKLRKGASSLLIEERGRRHDPKYAFVRRRPSASPAGRRKSSPKRVSVHLGLFG